MESLSSHYIRHIVVNLGSRYQLNFLHFICPYFRLGHFHINGSISVKMKLFLYTTWKKKRLCEISGTQIKTVGRLIKNEVDENKFFKLRKVVRNTFDNGRNENVSNILTLNKTVHLKLTTYE